MCQAPELFLKPKPPVQPKPPVPDTKSPRNSAPAGFTPVEPWFDHLATRDFKPSSPRREAGRGRSTESVFAVVFKPGLIRRKAGWGQFEAGVFQSCFQTLATPAIENSVFLLEFLKRCG